MDAGIALGTRGHDSVVLLAITRAGGGGNRQLDRLAVASGEEEIVITQLGGPAINRAGRREQDGVVATAAVVNRQRVGIRLAGVDVAGPRPGVDLQLGLGRDVDPDREIGAPFVVAERVGEGHLDRVGVVARRQRMALVGPVEARLHPGTLAGHQLAAAFPGRVALRAHAHRVARLASGQVVVAEGVLNTGIDCHLTAGLVMVGRAVSDGAGVAHRQDDAAFKVGRGARSVAQFDGGVAGRLLAYV